MERHCPICGHALAAHELVCPACRARIEAREPASRESVLYGWGRGLMLLLALFLFFKGAYATLSPVDYARTVRSFGLPADNAFAMSLNAAFVLATALLYAIAWMGSYLGRQWDATVCLVALVAFVVGQALTQFLVINEEGGPARSVAVFLFWTTVPVFQYVAFKMGRGGPKAQPAGRREDAA